MDKTLPNRPNLDHLRGQAKTLLKQLEKGNAAAVRAFLDHLPAARGMKPAALRDANFRLADAQSVVARQSGFESWPALARHVEKLRGLEGDWRIARLEIDGNTMPASVTEQARILIDGDRFRTESAEGTYEGILVLDTEADPPHFDIQFVAGPEAGNWSYGIYRLDGPDKLTLCLGLVHSSRPAGFATRPGGGHALEHLERVSRARPANVDGGTPPPPAPEAPIGSAADFEVALTPLYERLQGDWSATELVTDGKPMPTHFLDNGSRIMTGNELKVVFAGQTIIHAKVRIDETTTPIAVDYYNLLGKQKGSVTYGIMEWAGDEPRFLMAPAGFPRPNDFSESKGTLSRWRRRH